MHGNLLLIFTAGHLGVANTQKGEIESMHFVEVRYMPRGNNGFELYTMTTPHFCIAGNIISLLGCAKIENNQWQNCSAILRPNQCNINTSVVL